MLRLISLRQITCRENVSTWKICAKDFPQLVKVRWSSNHRQRHLPAIFQTVIPLDVSVRRTWSEIYTYQHILRIYCNNLSGRFYRHFTRTQVFDFIIMLCWRVWFLLCGTVSDLTTKALIKYIWPNYFGDFLLFINILVLILLLFDLCIHKSHTCPTGVGRHNKNCTFRSNSRFLSLPVVILLRKNNNM